MALDTWESSNTWCNLTLESWEQNLSICVNILNLSCDVWICHISAGEEPMIHGQEGHNGYLQALEI